MTVLAMCEQCRLGEAVPNCRGCNALNAAPPVDAWPDDVRRLAPRPSVVRAMANGGMFEVGRHPESIAREPTPADVEHVLEMKRARRREGVLERARGIFEHAAASKLADLHGDKDTRWWPRLAAEAEAAAEAWAKLEEGDRDRAHEAEQLARFVIRVLVDGGLSTSAESFRSHLEFYLTAPASVIGQGAATSAPASR